MWKRAEMSKFLVHLKQKELDTIQKVTSDWKLKETQRDQQFQDSLTKVSGVESRMRAKGIELQKREDRIVQLEEELKHKL